MGYAEITLDGCCSSGGAAHGLAKAGHYVIGVDTRPEVRDDYLRSGAHEFICASVLDVLSDPGFMARITFTWNSPPCQHFSRMCRCRPGLRAKYPDLITPSRPLLEAWGGPWAMENVADARPWMRDPVTLCMWMWGRETYRHRLVEAGGGLCLTPPACPSSSTTATLPPGYARSKTGDRPNRECGWPHPVPAAKAGHWTPGHFVSVSGHERKEPVQRVMEAPWMRNREDVAESIPWYLAYWAAQELAARRELEAAA
jgi:DNA (cytosine-5)-methyltransferase 1